MLQKEEGKKRRRQPTGRKMDSVIMAIGVFLGDLKEQIRDMFSWKISTYVITKCQK